MNETPSRSITLWIALAGIFTALTTVATVVLSPPLPAGFFNFGEAVIYLAAMLLGPVNLRGTRVPLGALVTGFAGSIGAMLGDAILGYPQYIPATLVLKFFEGLVAGLLFKGLKARMNEETLASGRTTVRVLMSGFLIAAAVIIIGVNYDPGATALWITIGSFFIVIVCISIVRGKIPVYYMVMAMLAGGIIMVVGYFVYELYVLKVATAFMTLPWNTVQALVGIIVAVPVYQAAQRARVLNAL
ncbi:MAG: ECF transporter S component [Candidatus Lokiarchaeota archaeon]|nr:ECF transporter S component [Candidatus Lokiarchaeota archaeon]